MPKLRRRRKRPTITDWDKPARQPTQVLPYGFPYVTCRPLCPGCANYSCLPVTSGYCQPGDLFYSTLCLPSKTCLPTVPVGCMPRPCTPA